MVSCGLIVIPVCWWPPQPSSFRTLFNFRFAFHRKALRTFKDLGQMSGEENIGCLAAAVSLERRPASSCLKIVPVDGVILVSFRGDVGDATWR